jgi:hypothetical protein
MFKKEYKFTQEHKDNLSQALRGRKCPWNWKVHKKTKGVSRNLTEAQKKECTEKIWETRRKNGTSNHTIESRKKMSLAKKGIKISEEHKAKISKYLKEHPEHPGLNYWKERKGTEEFDKMISQRLKGIKRCNTSIETKLQNWLKDQKISFETHYPVIGHPDIFIKPNICIFADGCY